VYNSVGVGPDGKIYGVAREGIYQIDPETNTAKIYARLRRPAQAGFAMIGNRIFYASGPTLSWVQMGQ
jgi:hypothetical protein